MIVVPNFEAQAVKSFLTGFDVSKFSADPVTRVCKYADTVKSYAVPVSVTLMPVHYEEGLQLALVNSFRWIIQKDDDVQTVLNAYLEIKNSPTRFFAVFVFPAASPLYEQLTILEIQQEDVKDFETQVLALNDFVVVS